MNLFEAMFMWWSAWGLLHMNLLAAFSMTTLSFGGEFALLYARVHMCLSSFSLLGGTDKRLSSS